MCRAAFAAKATTLLSSFTKVITAIDGAHATARRFDARFHYFQLPISTPAEQSGPALSQPRAEIPRGLGICSPAAPPQRFRRRAPNTILSSAPRRTPIGYIIYRLPEAGDIIGCERQQQSDITSVTTSFYGRAISPAGLHAAPRRHWPIFSAAALMPLSACHGCSRNFRSRATLHQRQTR